MKSYERRFVAAINARSCRGVCFTLDLHDFHCKTKKIIVLNLLNPSQCGVVGFGLGAIRKGRNEFGLKNSIPLVVQSVIESVVI